MSFVTGFAFSQLAAFRTSAAAFGPQQASQARLGLANSASPHFGSNPFSLQQVQQADTFLTLQSLQNQTAYQANLQLQEAARERAQQASQNGQSGFSTFA